MPPRAGAVDQAGFGERGRITVVDRQDLEDASCECYRVITDEHEQLVTSA
jgi:hypothetical protein